MPTVLLLLATMTTGLVAGVYLFYAHTVMPGLRRSGDRTFVAGFQALDRAILNPWFMVTAFLGRGAGGSLTRCVVPQCDSLWTTVEDGPIPG